MTDDPPNSIRAKALHALWWAVQPYLGKGSSKHKGLVTHCVPAATKASHTNGGQVNGVACGDTEDDCSCASVVHYNSGTGTLVLSFAVSGSARCVSMCVSE